MELSQRLSQVGIGSGKERFLLSWVGDCHEHGCWLDNNIYLAKGGASVEIYMCVKGYPLIFAVFLTLVSTLYSKGRRRLINLNFLTEVPKKEKKKINQRWPCPFITQVHHYTLKLL